MNRILFSAALIGVALLSASAAQAQNPVSFEVANFTLSGGDPVYSIVSDLTFTNLSLSESFVDGTTLSGVNLIGANGQSANSLNTTDIFLNSATVDFGAHGGLKSATLTGGFSATGVGIETAFGGPVVNTTINPAFTATLNPTGIGDFANIFAVDSVTGATYAAGTLALTPGAVPEPGAVALLAACGIGALPFLRRRQARRA